jgi:hypothetical protein
MEPNSLIGTATSPDTRLSTLIEKARSSREGESYLRALDRTRADRVFADIAAAVERGLRSLDPSSADAAVLEEIDNALKWR